MVKTTSPPSTGFPFWPLILAVIVTGLTSTEEKVKLMFVSITLLDTRTKLLDGL